MKANSNLGLTGLRLIAAAAAVLALGACESFQETLGLTKQVPDEFAVVTKAPLTMPPDYNLRPPTPGAARPQEKTPSEVARRALWKDPAETSQSAQANLAPWQGSANDTNTATASGGELALLKLAGAENPDPDILNSLELLEIAIQKECAVSILALLITLPIL